MNLWSRQLSAQLLYVIIIYSFVMMFFLDGTIKSFSTMLLKFKAFAFHKAYGKPVSSYHLWNEGRCLLCTSIIKLTLSGDKTSHGLSISGFLSAGCFSLKWHAWLLTFDTLALPFRVCSASHFRYVSWSSSKQNCLMAVVVSPCLSCLHNSIRTISRCCTKYCTAFVQKRTCHLFYRHLLVMWYCHALIVSHHYQGPGKNKGKIFFFKPKQ